MRKYIGLFAAAVAVAGGVTLAATGTADAATPALSVSLSACGTGSSVAWDLTGEPILTVGSANAGTCGAPAGSTYDPAYAKLTMTKAAGVAVPTGEPTFATNNYAQGSPRFVIDLNNGKSLVGYPPSSGLNGTDMAWAVGNSGTYTAYTTAYAATDANTTTVKDAYIVEDADQTPGTSDTLTNVQFNQQTLQVVNVGNVVVKSQLSGKCMNVSNGIYATGGRINQYTCGAMWHGKAAGAQVFRTVNVQGGGPSFLEALSPDTGNYYFVAATSQGDQLSLSATYTPDANASIIGAFITFTNHNLVADDSGYQTANYSPVIGWPRNGGTNQKWAFAPAP